MHTGTNLGNERIRLAAADFKPVGSDPETVPLKAIFDSTLYNDLSNAGIFDMVSKSLAPQAMPGSPQEFQANQWSSAPASAAMVAFGALSADERPAGDVWMADRRAHGGKHAGAGQPVQRGGQRRDGAHHSAPVCRRNYLSAGRSASTGSLRPKFTL